MGWVRVGLVWDTIWLDIWWFEDDDMGRIWSFRGFCFFVIKDEEFELLLLSFVWWEWFRDILEVSFVLVVFLDNSNYCLVILNRIFG